MSYKATKRWERYSLESLVEGVTDPRGLLFLSEAGQCNMEQVKVLHHGLDTVKQLYKGELRPDLLEQVERLYNEGFGECLELADTIWMVASGGASGYQYRLQNSDLGLILFIKSRYADRDEDFSHLKIECSPHWLQPRSVDDMGRELDALAAKVLQSPQPGGVAVHLCADVQGWEPPANLSERMVTRARRIVSHDSAKVLFMDMGEVALKFSKGQSYLLGSASTVQAAVYRKDIQAKAADKLDFWQSIWRNAGDLDQSFYQEDKPVWRVEIRFHHSVLADFGRGVAQTLEYGASIEAGRWAHIRGAAKHLQGLWQYGLNSFRLEHPHEGGWSSNRYLDPVWQLLMEDVAFAPPVTDLLYKRVKKSPGIGNEKNLMLAIGNLLSVYARNRFTPERAIKCIKKSGVYDDLYAYMERRAYADYRNFNEGEIFEFVRKGLQLRTLLGRAA